MAGNIQVDVKELIDFLLTRKQSHEQVRLDGRNELSVFGEAAVHFFGQNTKQLRTMLHTKWHRSNEKELNINNRKTSKRVFDAQQVANAISRNVARIEDVLVTGKCSSKSVFARVCVALNVPVNSLNVKYLFNMWQRNTNNVQTLVKVGLTQKVEMERKHNQIHPQEQSENYFESDNESNNNSHHNDSHQKSLERDFDHNESMTLRPFTPRENGDDELEMYIVEDKTVTGRTLQQTLYSTNKVKSLSLVERKSRSLKRLSSTTHVNASNTNFEPNLVHNYEGEIEIENIEDVGERDDSYGYTYPQLEKQTLSCPDKGKSLPIGNVKLCTGNVSSSATNVDNSNTIIEKSPSECDKKYTRVWCWTDCTCRINDPIIFEYNEWCDIFDVDKRKFKTKKYSNIFAQKLLIIDEHKCILNVKKTDTSQSSAYAVVFGYCAHPQCRFFKLIVRKPPKPNDNVTVHVYTSTVPVNHKEMRTRYLNGWDRKLAKDELRHTVPFLYQEKQTLLADNSVLERGNLQGIKSEDVIRKARSEELSKDDKHCDDFFDALLRQREQYDPIKREYEYIQFLGSPLQVYIYSKEQLELVLRLIRKNEMPTLHFDATGSIVRKLKDEGKVVFYYAGVIRVDIVGMPTKIFPVLELLTSQHHNVSIGNFLSSFKHYVETNFDTWPIFSKVVTDFSWAIINAICKFWNIQTISDYLDMCYDNVHNTTLKKATKGKIQIHLCCAHFIKMITVDIAKLAGKRRHLKKVVVEVLAAMFNMTEYKVIKELFYSFSFVLCSKEQSSGFKNAWQFIVSTCNGVTITSDNNVDIAEDGKYAIIDPVTEEPRIYKRSRFFLDCDIIKDQVLSAIEFEDWNKDTNETLEENKTLYCPDILKLILKKYMPFLPLWSGLMLDKSKHDNEVKRMSNAEIENYNNLLKTILLNKRRNQKLGRVFKPLRNNVLHILKKILYQIPNTRLAQGRRGKIRERKLACQPDDPNVKEEWKKKRKNDRPNYFKACTIQSINQMMKPILKTTDRVTHFKEPTKHTPEKIHSANLSEAESPIGDAKSNEDKPHALELKEEDVSFKFGYYNELNTEVNMDYGIIQAKLNVPLVTQTVTEHEISNNVICNTNSSINTVDDRITKEGDLSNNPERNKKPLFPNGLVRLPEYWRRLKSKKDYFIALYDTSWHRSNKLHFSQFITLQQKQGNNKSMWLHSNVIDTIAGILMLKFPGRNDCPNQYIPSDIAFHIFSSDSYTYYVSLKSNGVIYIVLNTGQHWVLLVADLETKTLCLLDPGAHSTKQHVVERYKKQFLAFLNRNNKHIKNVNHVIIDTVDWLVVEPQQYRRQSDSYNCGLFVVSYIWKFLGLELIDNFDTDCYRWQLQRYLLENGIDVHNTCYFCGDNNINVDATWVQCDYCQRWMHIDCLTSKEQNQVKKIDNDLKVISYDKSWVERYNENMLFCCTLCSLDEEEKVELQTVFDNSTEGEQIIINGTSCKILENGLINDTNYYTIVKTMDYYLSYYESAIYKDYWALRSSDFDTIKLGGDNWLSGTVVDVCSELILRRKSVDSPYVLIPSYIACKIFVLDEYAGDVKPLNTYDALLIPLNLRFQHWVLIVVHMMDRELFVMDPQGIGSRQINSNYLRSFTDFLSTHHKGKFPQQYYDIKCWNVEPPKVIKHNKLPLQTDGYNCGVFVLQYIQEIICNMGSVWNDNCFKSTDYNPIAFREKTLVSLIKESLNMQLICYCCGDPAVNNPWKSCKKCNRRFHTECVFINRFNPTTDFECQLCSNYFKTK